MADEVLRRGAQIEVEALIKKMIGEVPPNPSSEVFEDYMHTKDLLLQAWGGGMLAHPEMLLYRCLGCFKIRTNKSVRGGPCKCGSIKLGGNVMKLDTQELETILREAN